MFSEMTRLSAEMRDKVFVKTPQGRAEVAQRSARLNSKHRSILIMIDGEKSLAAVGTQLSEGELATTVELLLELELIGVEAGTAVPRAQADDLPAAVSPPPAESARLVRIKAMMVDSAEACLGLMASDVVRRVERARDETELLSVVGHWHMAMRESKYGREVAGIHLEQIKATLRGEVIG